VWNQWEEESSKYITHIRTLGRSGGKREGEGYNGGSKLFQTALRASVKIS
jgi:hypothetical protein